MRKIIILAALLAALAVGTATADQRVRNGIPTADELTPNKWNQIQLGGETICSRGTEYSFYVRPGDPQKLMIHFQGGGACWNGVNCSASAFQTFDEAVDEDDVALAGEGIFDFDNEENPVADFTAVGVMYCTADIHTGNATVDYGNVTIEHKGAVNAQAALDWVYENYPDPSLVFVNGCSAGSYGSIFHALQIAQHYPDARFVQLGDAGIGVITPDFYSHMSDWGMFDVLNSLYPEFKFEPETFSNEVLYTFAAESVPNGFFSEYTAAEDEVQIAFYELMGGKGADWAAKAQENLAAIEDLPNFASFTAPGDVHCILPLEEFYETESSGVRIRDWVADLVAGKPLETIKPSE